MNYIDNTTTPWKCYWIFGHILLNLRAATNQSGKRYTKVRVMQKWFAKFDCLGIILFFKVSPLKYTHQFAVCLLQGIRCQLQLIHRGILFNFYGLFCWYWGNPITLPRRQWSIRAVPLLIWINLYLNTDRQLHQL